MQNDQILSLRAIGHDFVRMAKGCGMTKFCLRMSRDLRVSMTDLVSEEDDVNHSVSTGLSAVIDEGYRMTIICIWVPSDTTVSEWQRGADNRKVSPRIMCAE